MFWTTRPNPTLAPPDRDQESLPISALRSGHEAVVNNRVNPDSSKAVAGLTV